MENEFSIVRNRKTLDYSICRNNTHYWTGPDSNEFVTDQHMSQIWTNSNINIATDYMDTLIGNTPINAPGINIDPQENLRLAIQSAQRFRENIQGHQRTNDKFISIPKEELLNLCNEFLHSKGIK